MGTTNLSTLRWTVGAALLAVGLLAGIGCEKADWESPQYINEKLKNGNTTEQGVALKKMSNLPEEKQKEVVPGLVHIYNQEGANQKKAMEVLVRIREPGAKDAYMKELKSDVTGYAGAAAEALGETKTKDAIPEMIELYKSTNNNDTKIAILRGFQYMPDDRMVAPLVETLNLSVDNHRIALHSYSCEILGEIVQDKPDLLDEDGVRTLVRAQYLSNKKGQSVQKECSVAIQQLGEPAIPILIETFKGENESVNRLLMKYRNDSAQYPANRAKVGAIQRLTSLRAQQAIDLYLEQLDRTIETPKNLPKKFVRPWWKFEAQSLDEMVLGLGDLQATKATETLAKTAAGENNEKWSEVLDAQSELQLRQDAAFALVRLGAREAKETLLGLAEKGVIKQLERRAMAMEKSEEMEPMDPIERYQFNWMNAKAFAFLATGEELDKFKSLAEGIEDEDRKPVRERLEAFIPMIELAKKCHGKDSDKATAKCFGEALESDDDYLREKAAWELNWLPSEAAAPVVIDHLDTNRLGTRETLTLALYRHPKKRAIAKIDEILEEEADETADSYKLDHYRLKLARAWLSNQFN